jgi:hypothetical protein
MLDRIFPRTLTNAYTGHPLAKWVFLIITVITLARSLAHILLPDGGAQSIATIPLDTYTQGGAAAVVTLFALWGLAQLLMGLVYVVVLWRYQAFIPFMYVLLLLEYAGRIAIGLAKPIETAGTAPGAVGDYVLVPLALVMLILALRQSKAAG